MAKRPQMDVRISRVRGLLESRGIRTWEVGEDTIRCANFKRRVYCTIYIHNGLLKVTARYTEPDGMFGLILDLLGSECDG